MRRKSFLAGVTAALAFGCSHAALAQKATPIPRTPALQASATATVFTVRYVCLVATPKTPLTQEEARASLQQEPPIFDEMQHGSPRSMTSTPDAFLHNIAVAQPDYTFKMLLSGSTPCVLGDEQAATISDGPGPSAYQATLSDSIFLTRNSPTNLTIHHTGQFAYTSSPHFRGGPGWLDTHTDKLVIGRVYTQGVDNLPDGRKVTYAFCVLPGDLDRTASAWNVHKTNGMKKTASTTAVTSGGRR